MAYRFSARSKRNLAECHPDLQLIAQETIKLIDFAVICGHRPKKAQDEAYFNGFSQVRWPNSRHNRKPAMAFDAIPYVGGKFVGWHDDEAFVYLAGHMMAVAAMLLEQDKVTHQLTWGGDFNRNTDLNDNWSDKPHYQI